MGTPSTTGSFYGGHVYVRYEISNVPIPVAANEWDLVLFDHPVLMIPVPPMSRTLNDQSSQATGSSLPLSMERKTA